ncbi:reverse transcriptase domain-containing protein, partial [Tanacetum coccineum]
RVIKDDSFMLEFDGSTAFKRVSVKADRFVRYPLNLVGFDAIKPADNKYLIDVAGYVSNVGRTNHLNSGSKNLDFHLANHRGQSIRVTLWGNLREVLVEKKTKQFAFSDKVYLSSTSSTVILDDAKIPAIKALKDANNPSRSIVRKPLIVSGPRQDGISPHAVVKAAGRVQPDKKDISFVNRATGVDFPMLRYRLELDVSNATTQTVVVLFDEPATTLVGCLAGSLMDTKEGGICCGLSFVKWETLFALSFVHAVSLQHLAGTFGGNTRDFGSFWEETRQITDLHQHISELSTQKAGGGVTDSELPRRSTRSQGRDQLVGNEVVRVKIPKCMSWLDAYDEPTGDLDMMEDNVDNPNPQSTP